MKFELNVQSYIFTAHKVQKTISYSQFNIKSIKKHNKKKSHHDIENSTSKSINGQL